MNPFIPPTLINVPLQPRMPWRVAEVKALPNFRLHVTFQDGLQGIVCLQQRVASENAGVFKSLADKAVFDAVTVRHGAVTWAGQNHE
jgi:hypothetical protein